MALQKTPYKSTRELLNMGPHKCNSVTGHQSQCILEPTCMADAFVIYDVLSFSAFVHAACLLRRMNVARATLNFWPTSFDVMPRGCYELGANKLPANEHHFVQ
eukprot:s2523_g5.t1